LGDHRIDLFGLEFQPSLFFAPANIHLPFAACRLIPLRLSRDLPLLRRLANQDGAWIARLFGVRSCIPHGWSGSCHNGNTRQVAH
jgi:hypothetical protein